MSDFGSVGPRERLVVHSGNTSLIVSDDTGHISLVSNGDSGERMFFQLMPDDCSLKVFLESKGTMSTQILMDPGRVYIGNSHGKGITIDAVGVTIHGGLVTK